MKLRKSTKWDNFKINVIEYIKEKGIASMQEVFEISNKYLHILYATSYFEKLASFLVTNCGCFRIDLAIPNPKPLSIYPNHHKISSTTFFVLEETDDNHYADVEKAKKILKELTQAALMAEDEKRKNKNIRSKIKTTKIDMEPTEKEDTSIKYRENQFRGRDCFINGFIPMISVQIQMIHQFIFDTFGSRQFTIQQFIDNMSLDFMSKVVGIKNIPEVLSKDIRFRYILVSCLPKRIQDQIQLSEAPQVLSTNFKRMSDNEYGRFSRQVLTKINDDTYQLIDSIKINFLDQFEISYIFTSREQINEFHFMLQIVDLLENIDPHSYSLWQKRFSIDRKFRGGSNKVTSKIINEFIVFPYNKTFPFFFPQVERFISKYGQNWCNLKSSLNEFYQNEDNRLAVITQCMYPSNGPVNNFCHGHQLKPDPFTLFSKITSKDFELHQNNHVGGADSNYFDPNLFFNFLSAIMRLFPSGLISNMNYMWDKAMKIFTEVTGVQAEDFLRGNTPDQLHFILRSKFAEYKDLCSFSTVTESIKVRKFDQQYLLSLMQDYKKREEKEVEEMINSELRPQPLLDLNLKMIKKQYMLKSEVFELTTSEYLDRFSINKLRYVLSRSTAEMVERLKILSLTPLDSITIKSSELFLSEIEDMELDGINNNFSQINSEIDEDCEDPNYFNSTTINGVLFLKLSNFLSERVRKFKRINQQFLRNGLNCELSTITPSIVYNNITYFFSVLQNNPSSFCLRAEINCGSIPFFLDDKMPIKLELEYKGNGRPKSNSKSTQKQQKWPKLTNSDTTDTESETEGTQNDDDDDEYFDDNILIDSSYLLNKLSNNKSRRSNNLSLIVKKLRLYDSVSVKLNNFLLPKITGRPSVEDKPSIPSIDINTNKGGREGKRGRGRGKKVSSQPKTNIKEIKSDNTGNQISTSPNQTILSKLPKLEMIMSFSSNFTSYPSDSSSILYRSFMQLFVVICQAWNGPDSQSFILICRLLYAFIDHKFSSGASLDSILDEFASFDIAFIFSGLSFLEQFDFIYKLRIDTAMPHFLSDGFAESRLIKVEPIPSPQNEQLQEEPNKRKVMKIPAKKKSKKKVTKTKSKKSKSRGKNESDNEYSGIQFESIEDYEPEEEEQEDYEEINFEVDSNSIFNNKSTFSEHIVPHIWINCDGSLDWKVMNRIMRKVVEVVEFEPGIEFTELAGILPSISPIDLFSLVDALEYDEVIYSVFKIDDDTDCDELDKPLFVEEVKSILSPPVDSTMYMYSLAVNMKNPLLKPAVKRNIFPTERCKFNLALVIEDESFL